MSQRLDHVVVVVPSRERGRATFEAAGFTVTPGGRHDALPTENALVCFADGSYLELLATLDPATRDELRTLRASDAWERHLRGVSAVARRFLPNLAGADGVADWALAADSLARHASRLRGLGVVASGPVTMHRERTDGERLEWQVLLPESELQPFWIADRTPRERRVPGVPSATTHANGARGVGVVRVRAPLVPTAALELGDALEARPSLRPDGVSELALADCRVEVVQGEPRRACAVTLAGCGGLTAELHALGIFGAHTTHS